MSKRIYQKLTSGAQSGYCVKNFEIKDDGVLSVGDISGYENLLQNLNDIPNLGYVNSLSISGYSGSGISGYSGYSGNSTSGWSGYSGQDGVIGKDGASGESGYSGVSGFSSESGYSGISGYSSSGFSGWSGWSGVSVSGFSGWSGSGISGWSGISGYSGGGSTPADSWPIGSVFLSVVSTNPNTLLGFGTWSRIAEGQFLVGQKSTDTDFDTAEETGGAKTVDSSHTHQIDPPATTSGEPSATQPGLWSGSDYVGTATHTHTTNIAEFTSGSSGSTTLSIVPPYFVVYMWKRTA